MLQSMFTNQPSFRSRRQFKDVALGAKPAQPFKNVSWWYNCETILGLAGLKRRCRTAAVGPGCMCSRQPAAPRQACASGNSCGLPHTRLAACRSPCCRGRCAVCGGEGCGSVRSQGGSGVCAHAVVQVRAMPLAAGSLPCTVRRLLAPCAGTAATPRLPSGSRVSCGSAACAVPSHQLPLHCQSEVTLLPGSCSTAHLYNAPIQVEHSRP